MNTITSTTSSQQTGLDRLAASILATGVLFVAGYTLTRTTLVQPVAQGNDVAFNTVIPHEATLWNADVEGF